MARRRLAFLQLLPTVLPGDHEMTSHRHPTILAVDPGKQGAIAFYNPDHARDAEVFDLPEDAWTLRQIIMTRTTGTERAVVELVAGRPGQAGVFTFGFGTGLVHGVLGCLGYKVETIPPSKWKPSLGLGPSTDKNTARALATQLFPHLAQQFARVKDDGRAEALLLAVYASHPPRSDRRAA